MDLSYALTSFDYNSIFAANNSYLTNVSKPINTPQIQIIEKDSISILPPAFQAAIDIEQTMRNELQKSKESEYYFEQQKKLEEEQRRLEEKKKIEEQQRKLEEERQKAEEQRKIKQTLTNTIDEIITQNHNFPTSAALTLGAICLIGLFIIMR
jgi:predicted ribosome quality control (RQC) complex YloA/Tae2 family protein